jgi:hypothetical protein
MPLGQRVAGEVRKTTSGFKTFARPPFPWSRDAAQRDAEDVMS